MGPPTYQSSDRSVWPCPACGDETAFSTLPHKAQYKDTVYCHRCGFRGDEADLLKLFDSRERWPERRARLEAMHADWKRLCREEEPTFSSRGKRGGEPDRVYDTDPREDEFSDEADRAVGDLRTFIGLPSSLESYLGMMALVEKSCRICARYQLHPEGLAGRVGFEAWVMETEVNHLRECDDPTCEWSCCVKRRQKKRKHPRPLNR